MKNLYTRTALILNYIKGKNINNWAGHQFDLLLDRVTQGVSKKDEQLWDLFIADFRVAFLDITHKQMAYAELEKLRMVNDNLNLCIATFNRVLKQADFMASDQGSVDRFKKGLKQRLQIACLKRSTEPDTMEEWQQAAREENLIFLKIQQLIRNNPTYTVQRQLPPKVFQHRGAPTKYWRPKGPNAMNVDAAQTTDDYTRKKEEFRKDRKETCKCFFCKRKGHIRKDCYQAIKAQTGGGSYTPRPAQNRVAEIVDDRSVIDEESYLNKDNFKEEFMKLEE
jgi:hypothetical protein